MDVGVTVGVGVGVGVLVGVGVGVHKQASPQVLYCGVFNNTATLMDVELTILYEYG